MPHGRGGGPATVPDEEYQRMEAFFTSPEYETLPSDSRALRAQIADSKPFANWIKRNTFAHKVAGYKGAGGFLVQLKDHPLLLLLHLRIMALGPVARAMDLGELHGVRVVADQTSVLPFLFQHLVMVQRRSRGATTFHTAVQPVLKSTMSVHKLLCAALAFNFDACPTDFGVCVSGLVTGVPEATAWFNECTNQTGLALAPIIRNNLVFRKAMAMVLTEASRGDQRVLSAAACLQRHSVATHHHAYDKGAAFRDALRASQTVGIAFGAASFEFQRIGARNALHIAVRRLTATVEPSSPLAFQAYLDLAQLAGLPFRTTPPPIPLLQVFAGLDGWVAQARNFDASLGILLEPTQMLLPYPAKYGHVRALPESVALSITCDCCCLELERLPFDQVSRHQRLCQDLSRRDFPMHLLPTKRASVLLCPVAKGGGACVQDEYCLCKVSIAVLCFTTVRVVPGELHGEELNTLWPF